VVSKKAPGLGEEEQHRPVDRRSFLQSTVLAAGAAAVSQATPAFGEEARRKGLVVDYPVVVVAVGPAPKLLLERRSGLRVEIRDPKGIEAWQPGDEAVVEEKLVNGAWRVSDITRMYRPIKAETVKSSRGQAISVSGGATIDYDSETQPRGCPQQGFARVPLEDVGAGDVVGGLSYLDPRSGDQIAALLGVRRRKS
jgi:hypothetical protein